MNDLGGQDMTDHDDLRKRARAAIDAGAGMDVNELTTGQFVALLLAERAFYHHATPEVILALLEELAAKEQELATFTGTGQQVETGYQRMARNRDDANLRADHAEAQVRRLREALALRPQVLAFAWLMEKELRENDHKGGWEHEHSDDLLVRLRKETEELKVALRETRERVGSEAADVANFAMMIADLEGALDLVKADKALRATAPAAEAAPKVPDVTQGEANPNFKAA